MNAIYGLVLLAAMAVSPAQHENGYHYQHEVDIVEVNEVQQKSWRGVYLVYFQYNEKVNDYVAVDLMPTQTYIKDQGKWRRLTNVELDVKEDTDGSTIIRYRELVPAVLEGTVGETPFWYMAEREVHREIRTRHITRRSTWMWSSYTLSREKHWQIKVKPFENPYQDLVEKFYQLEQNFGIQAGYMFGLLNIH